VWVSDCVICATIINLIVDHGTLDVQIALRERHDDAGCIEGFVDVAIQMMYQPSPVNRFVGPAQQFKFQGRVSKRAKTDEGLGLAADQAVGFRYNYYISGYLAGY